MRLLSARLLGFEFEPDVCSRKLREDEVALRRNTGNAKCANGYARLYGGNRVAHSTVFRLLLSSHGPLQITVQVETIRARLDLILADVSVGAGRWRPG
jgi:hypothetical protein